MPNGDFIPRTYKEKLEAEMLYNSTGGADLYLYRNTPKATRTVEQLEPPEGGNGGNE